jgi:YbbR domain-containing protein
MLEEFKHKAKDLWERLIQKSEEGEIADMGRERIIVFVAAFILAVCLWFMVNLNRVYNLNVEVPIQGGEVPQDQALAQELPEAASVSVTGEGWKLLSFYNNPPSVNVDVTASQVNLYDQVQGQVKAMSNVNVSKVQPLMLTLDLEPRTSKMVPVRPMLDVSFEGQYGFIGEPNLQPDSITISGATSLIDSITSWPTDSLQMSGVSGDISQLVNLKKSTLVSLSRQQVQFSGTVSQFTEGETTVPINTRNLPAGQSISFSPSSITVTFDVPISEYANVEAEQLFRAYLNYQQIETDSTGYVKPNIEQISGKNHIKIRSATPQQVAYFLVLDE